MQEKTGTKNWDKILIFSDWQTRILPLLFAFLASLAALTALAFPASGENEEQ